ncbi:MAG: tRNA-dihydrouridine synthase family protein, partial [Nanoarchaeota archaeon]|nr:tRNA-dihydrouridine synthase family protein [Nanoarchaeota archaeon]MBU4308613.1 tRNA-dihydrouridine synthase family protein [Nanoarchaeota archaeon]
MEIRNLKLKNRIFLAPMAEVNDLPFRLLCKKSGCGLTYTGMANPLSKQELQLDDKPALQIFTTNTKGLKEFIKKYEDKVSLFDFNLGCPAKTARKLGFGIFLHNKLDSIEEILKTMRQSTEKPITIKLRKSKNTFKIIKIANKYVDAIIIHPRTQQQGYSGEPDLDFAKRLKSKTKLPIIYSGNVNEKNYKQLLKEFDFVMIGREAIGNPNIFTKLTKTKQKNFSFKDWLELEKKYPQPFKQIKSQAMQFTKNAENAKDLRRKLILAKSVKKIKEVYGFL